MDDWKRAFKVINGKTPTKVQCEQQAPETLKGTQPIDQRMNSLIPPSKVIKPRIVDRIRKEGNFQRVFQSKLEKPKKRPAGDVASFSIDKENVQIKKVKVTIVEEKDVVMADAEAIKNTSGMNLFSPLKGWSSYKSPQKSSQSPRIPRTPSPKKRNQSSACRNISFLLNVNTPEKKPPEEEEELEVFADEKPEGARPPKTDYKPRKKKGNFVKLNMRNRTFVRGKKKPFKKFKKFQKR